MREGNVKGFFFYYTYFVVVSPDLGMLPILVLLKKNFGCFLFYILACLSVYPKV